MDPNLRKLLEQDRNETIRNILKLKGKRDKLTSEISERQDYLEALDRVLKTTTEPAPQTHSLAGMGFRDAVRTILRDSENTGMTSREMREKLLERGYIYEAQTPLSVRVSNEMRRMVQQNIMVKEGKKYLLTEKGWNM